jgi:TRAP transporter TAXI family solute receptor
MRGKIVAYPWGKNKGLLRQLKFAATLTRPWYKRAILVEERKSMWGLSRLGYFVGLAAVVGVLAVSWLALVYLFPAPPWKITIATATGGSTYELLGNRYKAILARSHVDVSVLLTNGGAENLRLLEDKNSGVAAGIVAGGVSDTALSPDLRSLGRVNYQPFWVFYRSLDIWPDLTSLKGKRIAVGPVGSDNEIVAKKLFELSSFNQETKVLPLAAQDAVKALAEGQVDAVFIAGAPDAPNVQTLLRDPNIRLMNFPRADALSRIFPFLVHLVLPAGAIDFADNIPPTDINLIGTTNAVLVRNDLHPQVVYLLTQALMEVHGDAGLFKSAGEFPAQRDPEYPMADTARDFYRNGPTFLNRYLPFWVVNYMQRAAAILVAATAIVVPIFSFMPRLFTWFREQSLRKLYRQLRDVEDALQQELSIHQAEALLNDLEKIDQAASVTPMRDSSLFFVFRQHLDQTRLRLTSRLVETRDKITKIAS